ncbi:MAG: glycosyltransferase [Mucilaginibacter polytrichastri]|nr:glycosyltransferase [Mucilaginibacter polytrichastri]
MEILQVTASYKPSEVYGGPTMSVSALCETLIAAGEYIEVLTTTANGKVELPIVPGSQMIVDGVPVTYFSRLTKDHSHFSPALLQALRIKMQGEKGPEIIHVHGWWNMVSVLSVILATRKNKPVVLSPRGMLSDYSFGNRKSLFKKIIFSLSRKALAQCHIHTTSIYEKVSIEALFTPKSITVIPNFVDLPKTTEPAEDKNEGKLKLLFLSRIEEKKGLDILFRTLAQVRFPYQLTIAGTGREKYLQQLRKEAESLGVARHIQWIGHQNNRAKFSVMQHHDLLILPSHDENFANVVLESLAMGTAVLLSDQVGLSDYVAENGLGWISSPNEKDLTEMLGIIADSRLVLSRIRERAPALIRSDFSRDKLKTAYRLFYTKILGA